MSNDTEDHHRRFVLAENVCNLLLSLNSSAYDEVSPKIEYWIEFALTERFATIDDLVVGVMSVAWEARGSHSDISRFLKDYRDAPHRSDQTRPFVDELCLRTLQWFAIASAEDLWKNWEISPVSKRGGPGFIHAASFVGHLIERGLVGRELVRRYVFKPLTTYYYEDNFKKQSIPANAIYQLFIAGNSLLQGLLESEDVRICFEKLEARVTIGPVGGLDMLDVAKLKVRFDLRFDASHQDLICGSGTSRDPHYVVAKQGGGRKSECDGDRQCPHRDRNSHCFRFPRPPCHDYHRGP